MLSKLNNKFQNLSIKMRLISGASFFTFIFLFTSVVSLVSLSTSSSALNDIVYISNVKTSLLSQIKDIAFNIDLDYSTIISTTDQFLIDEKLESIRSNNDLIKLKFQEYNRFPSNEETHKLYEEININIDTLLSVNDGLASTIKSGNLNGARILFTRGVHPTTLELVKKINDLSELEDEKNKIDSLKATSLNSKAFYILIILDLLYLFSQISLSYKLVQSITIPINYAIGFAQNIANGNLKQKVEIIRDDEAGKLLKYLIAMQESLRNIVLNIRTSSEESNKASSDFLRVSSQFLSTAREQVSTTEEVSILSQKVIEQNNSLAISLRKANEDVQLINGNMDLMKDSSGKINQLVNEFVIQSKKSTETAKLGETKINLSMQAMESIRDSAEKIQSVVTIITEISNKTNLLALNASIEAARAGESGRGFAVVADEVSKLAVSTAHSIKEIKQLVYASHENIARGVKEVGDISKLLNEIIKSITSLSSTTSVILNDLNEQTQNSDNAHKSIVELVKFLEKIDLIISDQVTATKNVGEKILRLKNTSDVISMGSTQIEGKAENLSQQAELIKKSADRFDI
jgi:methyl-accepting chemotaxis protein